MPSTERERIDADARLDSEMSSVYRALESNYDVICSDDLILADEIKNSACVTLSTKYDVYKYRLYGEGDGHYHVTQNLDVYEGTDLKFGKIKTDEDTVSKEKRFFLFKKGTLPKAEAAFSRLSRSAEKYFATKAVKSNKKLASQHIFNFYVTTVVLTLISVLVFLGFVIQGCVGYWNNNSITATLAKCVFGGVKTLWIIFGVTFVLTIIGAITHKKRVKPLRPTGRGYSTINYTKHSFIVVAIEFFSILFALLIGTEGLIAAIGNLLFPAMLACLIYPIVLFIFLGQCIDEFSVERVLHYSTITFTDKQYAELQNAEQIVRSTAASVNTLEIKEMLLRVIDYDTEILVTD